jgi:hypothetical protein
MERVETYVIAACEAVREHCVHRPNSGLLRTLMGPAKVRVVKDVEELGSKTKRYRLGQMKLSLQRKISLPGSEAARLC